MSEQSPEMESATKVTKINTNDCVKSTVDNNKKPDATDTRKQPKRKKEYKRLRFKGQIYQIGNLVIIKQADGATAFGKISKIIEKGGLPEKLDWPTIDVQLYYKKDKINKEKNSIDKEVYDHMGDNELFETNKVERVFVDKINGLCQV